MVLQTSMPKSCTQALMVSLIGCKQGNAEVNATTAD